MKTPRGVGDAKIHGLLVASALLGACAGLAAPPAPLPASLAKLACPLPPRSPPPLRPSLGPLALAEPHLRRCMQGCTPRDSLQAVLRIDADGTTAPPALVEPIKGCAATPQVAECVVHAWSKLCFEPSEQGLAAHLVVLERDAPLALRASQVPLQRYPPRYPLAAAVRGVGGHVHVNFDVSPSGRVKNIQVLESQPPGVFDKAVKDALRRWRYEPDVDLNWEPVWRRNVQIKMPFLTAQPP